MWLTTRKSIDACATLNQIKKMTSAWLDMMATMSLISLVFALVHASA
jgi:hypothetical protein